jgi:hypothetical protein
VQAAHEAAFAHFGGRCKFLLYDRMRTVGLGTSEGKPRLNLPSPNAAGHSAWTVRLEGHRQQGVAARGCSGSPSASRLFYVRSEARLQEQSDARLPEQRATQFQDRQRRRSSMARGDFALGARVAAHAMLTCDLHGVANATA